VKPWTPLASGALARAAWSIIDAIAATLAALPEAACADPTLSRGAAGIALFFDQLDRAQPDRGHAEAASRFLDHAFDGVAARALGAPLYQGFAGVAWAAERITGEAQEALDEPILRLLAVPVWERDYDLIVGLAGLGLWALDAVPRPGSRDALARVVHHLCEYTRPTPQGRCFFTAPHLLVEAQRARFPGGYENLGTAHGAPAAMAVLAEALADGSLPVELAARARDVLRETMRHFLTHAGTGQGPSRWPATVVPGQAPGGCRLAWCYGDTGVAATLAIVGAAAQAAGIAEAEAWTSEARTTALHAARRTASEAQVVDAGLCHGSAGNSILFARLHQRFGDPELAAAALGHIEATVAFHRPGRGVAGYQAWREPDPPLDEIGWLEGVAGIALALLAAVSDHEPRWDRPLYASPSPRSAG
jgi:lantibiotic modifying enzyme